MAIEGISRPILYFFLEISRNYKPVNVPQPYFVSFQGNRGHFYEDLFHFLILKWGEISKHKLDWEVNAPQAKFYEFQMPFRVFLEKF